MVGTMTSSAPKQTLYDTTKINGTTYSVTKGSAQTTTVDETPNGTRDNIYNKVTQNGVTYSSFKPGYHYGDTGGGQIGIVQDPVVVTSPAGVPGASEYTITSSVNGTSISYLPGGNPKEGGIKPAPQMVQRDIPSTPSGFLDSLFTHPSGYNPNTPLDQTATSNNPEFAGIPQLHEPAVYGPISDAYVHSQPGQMELNLPFTGPIPIEAMGSGHYEATQFGYNPGLSWIDTENILPGAAFLTFAVGQGFYSGLTSLGRIGETAMQGPGGFAKAYEGLFFSPLSIPGTVASNIEERGLAGGVGYSIGQAGPFIIVGKGADILAGKSPIQFAFEKVETPGGDSFYSAGLVLGKDVAGTRVLNIGSVGKDFIDVGSRLPGELTDSMVRGGYIPSTPLETSLLYKNVIKNYDLGTGAASSEIPGMGTELLSGKSTGLISEAEALQNFLSLRRETYGVQSEFMGSPREVFGAVMLERGFKPETVSNVLDFLETEAKNNGLAGGSAGQLAQEKGMSGLQPHDLDLYLKDAGAKSGQLLNIIESTEGKGFVFPSGKGFGLVMKERGTIFDIHDLDKLGKDLESGDMLSSFSKPKSGYVYFGIKGEDPISIDGFRVLSLSEQATRKGGEIFTVQADTLFPAAHRIKDYAGELGAEFVLVKSMEKAGLDVGSAFEKLGKQESYVKQKIPGFTSEQKSDFFVRLSQERPDLLGDFLGVLKGSERARMSDMLRSSSPPLPPELQ